MRTCRIILVAAAASVGLAPQSARAQAADAKTAEQVFKNIIQLKGTPADQVQPAMQFIAASLGMDCAFCHVQGKMEADDKGAKRTAREMMAMTAAINTNSFRGQRQVTCYSCHRGSTRPVNMPPVLESDAPASSATAAAAPGAPVANPGAQGATVDQILEKYVAAIGGADAMKKVTSRVMTGKILAGGSETPIDVITKAPNMRVSITHNATGDSFTAFDGTAGWLGSTGHAAREMSAAESAAAGLDAEFYLGLRVKELFPQLRRGRPETVAGAECEVLNGTAPGRPAVRLYFDKSSGLLVRMVRYADTPMGRNPTQIDYADYRDADGVKIPFRWTLSRPNARFTIQIAEVKSNAAVDDARFAKPAGEVK
ncbi:MAG: c-type cytochrome [Bryobacteraceae bacterium]|jgi:photosynthetic reaction center cytochrome c subunit